MYLSQNNLVKESSLFGSAKVGNVRPLVQPALLL